MREGDATDEREPTRASDRRTVGRAGARCLLRRGDVDGRDGLARRAHLRQLLQVGDDVQFTVAEVKDGAVVPYPDRETNETSAEDPAAALVSVQSVVVDPADRLWILDTGSPCSNLRSTAARS